jgi:hypothetical protein
MCTSVSRKYSTGVRDSGFGTRDKGTGLGTGRRTSQMAKGKGQKAKVENMLPSRKEENGVGDARSAAVPRESATTSLSWARIYLKKQMPGVTISLCQHRRRRPGNAASQSNPTKHLTRGRSRGLFPRPFQNKITGSSISSNTPCS